MAKRKRKQKTSPLVERFLRPTPEREAHNDTVSAGAAVRIVPVIVRLWEADIINRQEFEALAYYRDQASMADRSPVKSSLDYTPSGGNGPGVAVISAQIETGRIERNMGPLWPLARAVAVNDMTIPQWCITNKRSIEEGGRIRAHPEDMAIALMELKYAAGGIVK